MFVPFGKLECFGSRQLAVLTARQQERPGHPKPVRG
jgi:hypothetical protein